MVPTGSFEYGVVRFTSTGAIDTTFGANGASFSAFGSDLDHDGIYVSVGSDGSIVVLGKSDISAPIVRFDAAGALDATLVAMARSTSDRSCRSPLHSA